MEPRLMYNEHHSKFYSQIQRF